jgi:hypothetical protein
MSRHFFDVSLPVPLADVPRGDDRVVLEDDEVLAFNGLL